MTLGNTEKFFTGEISLDNLISPFKASCAYTEQKFVGYVFTDRIPFLTKANPEEIKEKTKLLEQHAEKLAQMVKN